jgi:hypothetical protein
MVDNAALMDMQAHLYAACGMPLAPAVMPLAPALLCPTGARLEALFDGCYAACVSTDTICIGQEDLTAMKTHSHNAAIGATNIGKRHHAHMLGT